MTQPYQTGFSPLMKPSRPILSFSGPSLYYYITGSLCVMNVSLAEHDIRSPFLLARHYPGLRGYCGAVDFRSLNDILTLSVCLSLLTTFWEESARVSQVAVLSLDLTYSLPIGKPLSLTPNSEMWSSDFFEIVDLHWGTFRGSITEIFEFNFLQASYTCTSAANLLDCSKDSRLATGGLAQYQTGFSPAKYHD